MAYCPECPRYQRTVLRSPGMPRGVLKTPRWEWFDKDSGEFGKSEAANLEEVPHRRNPHIVRFFEWKSLTDRRPGLVMKRLARDLDADLRAGKPINVDRTIRGALEIADALESLHSIGIVHRDVEPVNFVIRVCPGAEQFVLTDSSHAGKVYRPGCKFRRVGKEPFSPREQRYDWGDELSDVESLGPSVSCLVTGSVRSKPTSRPEAPRGLCRNLTEVCPALAGTLAKAQAPQPKDRNRFAVEFRRALTGYSAGPQIAAAGRRRSSDSASRAGFPSRRRPSDDVPPPAGRIRQPGKDDSVHQAADRGGRDEGPVVVARTGFAGRLRGPGTRHTTQKALMIALLVAAPSVAAQEPHAVAAARANAEVQMDAVVEQLGDQEALVEATADWMLAKPWRFAEPRETLVEVSDFIESHLLGRLARAVHRIDASFSGTAGEAITTEWLRHRAFEIRGGRLRNILDTARRNTNPIYAKARALAVRAQAAAVSPALSKFELRVHEIELAAEDLDGGLTAVWNRWITQPSDTWDERSLFHEVREDLRLQLSNRIAAGVASLDVQRKHVDSITPRGVTEQTIAADLRESVSATSGAPPYGIFPSVREAIRLRAAELARQRLYDALTPELICELVGSVTPPSGNTTKTESQFVRVYLAFHREPIEHASFIHELLREQELQTRWVGSISQCHSEAVLPVYARDLYPIVPGGFRAGWPGRDASSRELALDSAGLVASFLNAFSTTLIALFGIPAAMATCALAVLAFWKQHVKAINSRVEVLQHGVRDIKERIDRLSRSATHQRSGRRRK